MRVIPIDTLWLPEGEEELATGMANFVVKRNAARKENGGTLALDSRFGGIDPAKPKEAGSLLLYRIGLAQQIGATTLGDLVSTGLFDQTVVRVLAMELMSFIKDVDTLNTSAKLIQVMDTAGTAMRGLVKAAQDKATGFVRDNKGTLTTISFVEQNTGLSGRILNAVDHNLPTDNGSFRAQVGSPSDKTVLSLKLPFNRAFNPKDYL
jgi:hypothetical protein